MVEGSILAFNGPILISYFKMADVSQSSAIFVTDALNTQYPCEPVQSRGAYQEVLCDDLSGEGIILDLAGQDLPDSIFVLTSSDPASVKFETSLINSHNKKQLRELQSCTG